MSTAFLEGLRGQDRGTADAVATGTGAEQDHLVAGAGRGGEVDVLMAQNAHGQSVDQRVRLVGGVEDGLAADVRQTERVAIAADPGDHAVDHACGVRMVDRAEAQLVHDGDRASSHGDDVADDPAHAGRGALVGLDVTGVVVRLDLEGHGPAIAHVHDAGILADAHEHALLHGIGGVLAEGGQVLLRGLVGAVLGPHDRVHRELRVGGTAPQDLRDARVLLGLQAQLREGLILVRGRGRDLDGVEVSGGGRCRDGCRSGG
jgi:hypothetical protein